MRQSIGGKEPVRSGRTGQIEIIIEIDKMLCQTGDSVQVKLKDRRIECRQVLLRDIVRMVHQMQFRI